MNIENMTSAELFVLAENKKAEEILAEQAEETKKPEVILPRVSDADKRLIRLAGCYVEDYLDGREIDENYAFELVMEIVYGKDIWEWWDKRC